MESWNNVRFLFFSYHKEDYRSGTDGGKNMNRGKGETEKRGRGKAGQRIREMADVKIPNSNALQVQKASYLQ